MRKLFALNHRKKIILSLFLGIFVFQMLMAFTMVILPTEARAEKKIENLYFTPQVSIPGTSIEKGVSSQLEASTKPIFTYIKNIYNYAIMIAGILAVIVIMIGGVFWLASAGNASNIEKGKDFIGGGVVGLLLALGSYMILGTVNTELVAPSKFAVIPGVTSIQEGGTICCDPDGGEASFNLQTDSKGNRVFASDTSKKFLTCKFAAPGFTANAVECKPEEKCKAFGEGFWSMTSSFKCVNEADICCSCSVGLFGSSMYTACKDHTTPDECEKFCKDKSGNGNIGYTTYTYPGTYTCGTRESYNWCSSN
ncbi:MAG: pilin [Planctomycetes bacterium]|jgi:hypothetical protein|nr:pilin [Planctomycetota bacterium]